ncbi:hypothetical protein [Capnocytophaga gingivalis]|uniref:hypothetical protein n=1 Tax=Capnocytophaga gingivalis TaxID=1017 RepID=UPI00403D656C
MNGLQKLQQKLKNGDFFMIQKAVSQALTVFFCVKKLLKKDASLPVIFLSLLRFFYRPPISFLASDFFPRPPISFLAPRFLSSPPEKFIA